MKRRHDDGIRRLPAGWRAAPAVLLAVATCLSPACSPDGRDGAAAPPPSRPPDVGQPDPTPPSPADEPMMPGADGTLPKSSQEEVERAAQQTEGTAPTAPASAEEIERYTRKLAERIAADRAGARRGDLLVPGLVDHLHWTFGRVVQGPEGADLLESIRESAPGDLPLRVNGEYPRDAPVATVPPQLLKRFPPLPEGVEYRFVGCRLILLARESRVVLDYTERCFL